MPTVSHLGTLIYAVLSLELRLKAVPLPRNCWSPWQRERKFWRVAGPSRRDARHFHSHSSATHRSHCPSTPGQIKCRPPQPRRCSVGSTGPGRSGPRRLSGGLSPTCSAGLWTLLDSAVSNSTCPKRDSACLLPLPYPTESTSNPGDPLCRLLRETVHAHHERLQHPTLALLPPTTAVMAPLS